MAKDLAALRAALRNGYPKIADLVSDDELDVMLRECREKLGKDCTQPHLVDCAVARAADVASERQLGRP